MLSSRRARHRAYEDGFGLVALCAAVTALCAVLIAAVWAACLYIVSGSTLSGTSREAIEAECKGSLVYDYILVSMCLTPVPICACVLSCIIDKESRFHLMVTRLAVALCFGCAFILVVFGMHELVGRGCQNTALIGWRVFVTSCLWVGTHCIVMVLSVIYWVRNRHTL